MSIPAINPISEPAAASANLDIPIPLSQRAGAAQAASNIPSIDPISDPNLGDLYDWLMGYIELLKDPNMTQLDDTNKYGSKKELSDLLMLKLKSYKSDDGKSAYGGIDKMLTVISSLQDKFVAHGASDMADFLNCERVRLTGVNLFMSPWIQRAISPSIENGGKPMPWDPDDDPFDNNRYI